MKTPSLGISMGRQFLYNINKCKDLLRIAVYVVVAIIHPETVAFTAIG
jgi:hypothetical protein